MEKHLRFLSLGLVLCAFNAGCSRQTAESGAKFSVTLPDNVHTKVSSKSWGSLLPSSIANINCYLVMVEGSEAAMRDNVCKNPSGTTVANPGLVFGGYAPGTTIEVTVTPGERTIYIVGVEAVSAAACIAFKSGSGDADYGAPAILAKTSRRLVPGPNEITLTASLSGAVQIDSCTGPDFPASAPSNEPLWVTDSAGVVFTSVVHNDKLYIGGAFSYVGPHNGNGAELNTINGKRIANFNAFKHKVLGDVRAAIPDGNGGWYIGGDFVAVGSQSRLRLARINSDGSPHPWEPAEYPGSMVTALALQNGKLIVGGQFTEVGAATRGHLASYDLSSTPSPLTAWNPDLGDTAPEVHAMDVDSSGNLYVAGAFEDVGGTPRYGAAKFDSSGTLTSWNPDLNAYSFDVKVSKANAGRIYLCGGFDLAGSDPRSKVAAVDATTGAALAFTASTPIDGGTCRALAEDPSGNLYVGGDYLSMSGEPSMLYGPYKLSPAGMLDTSFNPDIDAPVSAMAFANGKLFLGGDFIFIDWEDRYGLGALNADGSLSSWNSAAAGIPRVLAVQSGRLYVGSTGDMSIGGAPRSNFAVIDLISGRATDADLWTDNTVFRLVKDGSNLLIGGGFSWLDGEERSGFAMVDLATDTIVANVGDPAVSGTLDSSATVFALAADSAYLYIGHDFSDFDGNPNLGYLFRVNKATGVLDSSWNPMPDWTVRALLIDGPDLYAAGDFIDFAGEPVEIAKVNKDSLAIDPTFVSPMFDDSLYNLYLNAGKLYVTGAFNQVDDGMVHNSSKLIRMNATDGVLDTTWLSDADSYIEDLLFNGNDLYLIGDFETVGGSNMDGVARFDLTDPAFNNVPAFNLDAPFNIWAFSAHIWNNQLIITGDSSLSARDPVYSHIQHFSNGIIPVNMSGHYLYGFSE